MWQEVRRRVVFAWLPVVTVRGEWVWLERVVQIKLELLHNDGWDFLRDGEVCYRYKRIKES